VESFDAAAFDISPSAALLIDPQQRMMLEVSKHRTWGCMWRLGVGQATRGATRQAASPFRSGVALPWPFTRMRSCLPPLSQDAWEVLAAYATSGRLSTDDAAVIAAQSFWDYAQQTDRALPGVRRRSAAAGCRAQLWRLTAAVLLLLPGRALCSGSSVFVRKALH